MGGRKVLKVGQVDDEEEVEGGQGLDQEIGEGGLGLGVILGGGEDVGLAEVKVDLEVRSIRGGSKILIII